MHTLGNLTFGYNSPQQTYTDSIGTSNYYVWVDQASNVTNPIEVNVAGWEKDEIEVTQDGQYVVVSMSEGKKDNNVYRGTEKKVYVGNNKVSKATYKAGMLTLHFEDTTSVIPIE